MLSQYDTAFEIRVNKVEKMALTDAFKFSIDVQLGTIEFVVTPVLAKTQILKFYQFHMGKKKAENSHHCPNVCESSGQFKARICLRTSNLLDSYYL